MSGKIVAFNSLHHTPDMDKVLAAASAYAGFWEKRTFEFLPLLHTSVERHYKGFTKYSESFAKNAEVLAVGIKSENIELLLNDFHASMGDPDEEEFLLEEIQQSVSNIGKKMDAMLAGVETSTKSIASLPVYDASRDHASFLDTQAQLARSLEGINVSLDSKRNDLGVLEKAIEVFEANGIEEMFDGKLPTVDQVQNMVSLGATPAGVGLVVEQALESLNKLASGIQDGMRYSQLQDQRRAIHAEVGELVAQQRQSEQRAKQIEGNLQALTSYLPLAETRQEWLTEKNQIRLHLEQVRDQLRRTKIDNAERAQQLNPLLVALMNYVQHIVVKFREAF